MRVELYAFDQLTATVDDLSVAERARMNSLPSDSAERFAKGRCLLRRMLGDQLSMHPSHLELKQAKSGGPVTLVAPHAAQPLHFSVAHSGRFVAAAVHDRPVGIDIEDRAIERPNWRKVAERYFCAGEKAALSTLNQFYQLWTLKEAITKMEQGAIAHYLSGVEIDITTTPPALVGMTPLGQNRLVLDVTTTSDTVLASASL